MYFPTVLSLAVLATSVAGAPSMTRANTGRVLVARDNCGSFYDNYLGPGSAGPILGGGQCQNLRKDGEGPNDDSTYTLNVSGACIHCNFYSDENCGRGDWSVGNNRGADWSVQNRYGLAKSFDC